MHPQSLAEEEIKTEQEVVEGMDISTRSKVSDPGPAERVAQKRKIPSPPHSSNGHSPTEPSASPIKKKKNSHNKEQSELRHGPFYYMKQPLTTDPVDVVPQDGRNDFYCWVCHREGQVLCCELCPRVYHAKCLKLTAEPEGDWFCPECEKITVAECIETQSKAMTMLTIDQLSYLLKFALQKMKQPGDQPCSPLSPHAAAHRREPINWTEPFQKPVSLEQHPDYAEYIFHAMDLCTLEKNIKKKMYGCTEAFLADVKWILHNCIIYNGGNHKLTATAKVIIKICEHEMNEIEVCPECYLSACQKRENWFCEPCTNPHPLVWAKLKGFPFWPAKALRDKDGQVDARFFGQHDRAWVPINNCYLMSKEIPFSVKKTKSIFNSAMQEMEIYVDNIGKKFAVFNYAPFRTPYTPNNQFQMLLDPTNPTGGTVRPDKQEKIKFSFDMTASPKIILSKPMLSSGTGRRISLTDMPRSPMSTNSSVHTGSDIEQDATEKSIKAPFSHYSAGEESMDFTDRSTASPASAKMGHAGSVTGSPKPFSSQSSTPIAPKQERTSTTGSILNLNLDRSKAEMDLKELSESVQQQSTALVLTSPKRQIRSRFQLNLDKTIESCKAQLGINEISENAYTGVEHSDSEDSEKSDSSDSEYMSEDEQKLKNGQDEDKSERDLKKKAKLPSQSDVKTEANEESKATEQKTELLTKERSSSDLEKEHSEKLKGSQHSSKEKLKAKEEVGPPPVGQDMDSDSDGELVIDLGEDHAGRDRKKSKKEQTSTNATKETPAAKQEGKVSPPPSTALKPAGEAAASSLPSLKDSAQTSTITIPINVVSIPAASLTSSTAAAVKKQRPLLPRETAPAIQRAVVWNSTNKFQTSSQKWHMQKVQRQQQQQNQSQNQQQQQNPSPQNTQQQSSQKQTQPPQPAQPPQPQQQQQSSQPSTSTRYQTRQAVKAVQQKEVTQSTSTSSITLVTSTPAVSMITTPVTVSTPSTSVNTDFQIATTSADVAADIAKYTSKIMDAIKGTMTEIYNDLSKSTSGNTIQEIRRLRIEIDKLQWLHQQELSEMKHNLELTMAEMRQSLEQERDRLMAEVKKQTELEKQQAVDETKKKQWCANCKKEAIFYCCWNTSYCDYPCQQAHWPEHMKSCTQSATASQQEAETETNTGASSKTSQQSASVQPPATETTAAAHEKDSSVEKSKDNDTIATGVKSSQPIKLVQVPQTTTFISNSQPTITIPVVVGPSAGTVAVRTGVQYVQATMPVQVRRV
ncbi:protein kinase C-binding protein 1-like isoform X1 [Acipenser oxyrinchus oxyrinchus]|uniref:Protein kinase C-binding protein 1-like isoform X1 n=1 Tax=Acipenser oxyrinchus oxyrinchus TaxID=40147 RepID=A0AAD8FZQ4_ACIOX|nr:protein kinase C-binding protein 1-like isoform X1 [Acipenser oxyrinchus oxyrinchus]